MNAQDEIAQLKLEVEQLRKALGERQQLSAPNLPSLRNNFEFITDLSRFSEGLISEAAVRKKYHFSEDAWERLGVDDKLIEAVEAERVRRIRSGEAKREKAQQHIVKAPDVLNGIMTDPKANAKHRIDSAKALDDLAEGGPRAAHDDADRVLVTINLGGGDVFRYGGSLKPTPGNDGKLIEHDNNTPGLPGFAVD